jgi:hypothetical protein
MWVYLKSRKPFGLAVCVGDGFAAEVPMLSESRSGLEWRDAGETLLAQSGAAVQLCHS